MSEKDYVEFSVIIHATQIMTKKDIVEVLEEGNSIVLGKQLLPDHEKVAFSIMFIFDLTLQGMELGVTFLPAFPAKKSQVIFFAQKPSKMLRPLHGPKPVN